MGSKNVKQSNGEAVPPSAEKFIHDVLTIPDLASVQASLDRNRLLLQSGTDVAAMALDAALSIQASNSLEKMLAHHLAARIRRQWTSWASLHVNPIREPR